jgi:hypothetical protein
MSKHEIWRVNYVKDAYADQTGATHWGYIVREQKLVTETGRFAVQEPYSEKWYNDAGIIAVDDFPGHEYRYRPNLTDYWGGGSWTNEMTGEHWIKAPYNVKGYVYPDGTGPVEKLK